MSTWKRLWYLICWHCGVYKDKGEEPALVDDYDVIKVGEEAYIVYDRKRDSWLDGDLGTVGAHGHRRTTEKKARENPYRSSWAAFHVVDWAVKFDAIREREEQAAREARANQGYEVDRHGKPVIRFSKPKGR